MRINIGCGHDYREGWINTDISPKLRCNYVHDIREEKLPVEDGEAEEVYCSGVLEQLQMNEDLLFALNEMWRVLKKGGKLTLVVPNAEHSIAFQDPMDVRKFVPKTFNYFVEGEREYQLYGKIYGFKPWSSVSIQENQRHILIVTLVK
jgi:predicted SAM-dependent methyltransferase